MAENTGIGNSIKVSPALTDLIRFLKGRLMKVHGGFARAYMAVRDQVLEVLENFKDSCDETPFVLATGHSLGACGLLVDGIMCDIFRVVNELDA